MQWRCPHCLTPQPLASRCWVCHRSSTSCGTCRHFRRSVAARVGYCGLDRRREPLHGDEVRACWEDGSVAAGGSGPDGPGLLGLLGLMGEAAAEPVTAPPNASLTTDPTIAAAAAETSGTSPRRDASLATLPGSATPSRHPADRAGREWVEIEV